jgi:hypothetical protein
MFSLNGNKMVYMDKLVRSTHQTCLNCGSSSEIYGQRYCKICFERDNWGEFSNYLDKLKDIKHERQQKISSNCFYAKFWYSYNDLYDYLYD